MKITGTETEIPEYFLKGDNITKRSAEHLLWYATDELGKKESVEICFESEEKPELECIGFGYDVLSEILKFNALINLGRSNFIKKIPTPISISSHLSIFDEKNVSAEAISKFICRKKPIFEIKTFVKRESKPIESSLFLIPKSVPSNTEHIGPEQEFWKCITKIKFYNGLLPNARNKFEFLEIISGLKENIEIANIAYLDMMKSGYDFPLCRQINMV